MKLRSWFRSRLLASHNQPTSSARSCSRGCERSEHRRSRLGLDGSEDTDKINPPRASQPYALTFETDRVTVRFRDRRRRAAAPCTPDRSPRRRRPPAAGWPAHRPGAEGANACGGPVHGLGRGPLTATGAARSRPRAQPAHGHGRSPLTARPRRVHAPGRRPAHRPRAEGASTAPGRSPLTATAPRRGPPPAEGPRSQPAPARAAGAAFTTASLRPASFEPASGTERRHGSLLRAWPRFGSPLRSKSFLNELRPHQRHQHRLEAYLRRKAGLKRIEDA